MANFKSDKQRKAMFASMNNNKSKSTSIRDTKRERDNIKPIPRRTNVVQANYGNGWEDVYEEDDDEKAKSILKDYNDNEKYPHRIVRRDNDKEEAVYKDRGVLGTDAEHKARIDREYKECKFDKRLSYKGEPNEIEVRELELYTENDSQLYNSQKKYIDANLDKKKANGTYTRKGAEVSYLNLTNASSRKYEREEAGRGLVFTKADKVQVAKNLAESHEREYDATHK